MASAGFRRELAQTIETTLMGEARRNELIIAYCRLLALLLTTGMYLVSHLYPREARGVDSFPVSIVAFAASWTVLAGLILWPLRRGWYTPRLRWALPLGDSLLLLALCLQLVWALPVAETRYPGLLVNIAAICGLLAVSGSLRLSRRAAAFTTGLALVNFVVPATLLSFGWVRTVFAAGIIVVTGILALWMTEIMRRAMRAEIGRAVLSRFLPKSVIEDAHQDPLHLLASPKRLDATVLMSDVRGFTGYAETLTPTKTMEFLNELQGMLAALVREHGGMVDKFMGDGMLAVFGAPDAHAEHAAQALRAAADMLAAVAALNTLREGRGDPRIRLGIGIHSGPVVVGCLGSGLRLEFTIIGDTVNTASRLEKLTKETQQPVLVSEATLRLADAHTKATACVLCDVGEVAVRGRRQTVRIHALTPVTDRGPEAT